MVPKCSKERTEQKGSKMREGWGKRLTDGSLGAQVRRGNLGKGTCIG